MMAVWTSVAEQTVNPGEAIIFTEASVPCNLGLVLHRDGTGDFLIKGIGRSNGGCCCRNQIVNYKASFGANIAVPTGQTVGAIDVAFALNGTTLPGTVMEETPAAVEEYANVSRDDSVPIWKGCCQSFSVRNVSSIPILVRNATLVIDR